MAEPSTGDFTANSEYTLGPLLGGATSPPTNLWAIRREWLRIARFDTNPSHPIYARWMLL